MGAHTGDRVWLEARRSSSERRRPASSTPADCQRVAPPPAGAPTRIPGRPSGSHMSERRAEPGRKLKVRVRSIAPLSPTPPSPLPPLATPHRPLYASTLRRFLCKPSSTLTTRSSSLSTTASRFCSNDALSVASACVVDESIEAWAEVVSDACCVAGGGRRRGCQEGLHAGCRGEGSASEREPDGECLEPAKAGEGRRARRGDTHLGVVRGKLLLLAALVGLDLASGLGPGVLELLDAVWRGRRAGGGGEGWRAVSFERGAGGEGGSRGGEGTDRHGRPGRSLRPPSRPVREWGGSDTVVCQ